MPIRYVTITQRKKGQVGKVQVPQNLKFNVFDIYQTVADDIIVSVAPLMLQPFGTGQYRCTAIPAAAAASTEVFISLDPEELLQAEQAANITAEGSSKIKWYKVGDDSVTNGMFSFDSPFTLIKFKFAGGTIAGKVILASN